MDVRFSTLVLKLYDAAWSPHVVVTASLCTAIVTGSHASSRSCCESGESPQLQSTGDLCAGGVD